LDGIYAALADLPVEVDVLVCTPEEIAEWAQNLGPPVGAAERVEIMPAFPSELRGRLVFLPQDNLNTDGIYGKDYTYRDDVTREVMAKVVMENYDLHFAEFTRPGDVVWAASSSALALAASKPLLRSPLRVSRWSSPVAFRRLTCAMLSTTGSSAWKS
jgi:hypothetical protein